MKTYELDIFVVDAAGNPRKHGASISVVAVDPDAALAKAREEIAKRKLPPLRTLNITPDGRLVAYCGDKPQRPVDPNKHVVWKRPMGPGKEL